MFKSIVIPPACRQAGALLKRGIHVAVFLLLASPAFALRIVSLMPSNTEIVEALGAGDELVGVSSYDRIPAGSSRVNVGDLLNPQWEILVSLHPDLVLAGHWASSPAAARLKALHIPMVEVAHPQSMEALYDSIRQIAQAIHRPSADAERVIAGMQKRFAALAKAHAGRPTHSVYIEIDPPTWTIGAKDYLDDGFTALGLTNVFRNVPRLSAEVSAESILEKNPEVIIVLQDRAAAVARRPGWSGIRAVQNHWIIDDINANDLARPSPRLLDGLEQLDRRLHALGVS